MTMPNMSELGLIELRQAIYRRNVQVQQTTLPVLRLLAQAAVDDRAKCALLRTLYDTKVVLYGDGRLLLDNRVWALLRNNMRFPVQTLHAKMSENRWTPIYLADNPPIQRQWHRTRLTGNRLYPEAVEVALVPADYSSSVSEEDAYRWLGFAVNVVLDEGAVPDGVLLAVPGTSIEVAPGNVAVGELRYTSGVPPVVFTASADSAAEHPWVSVSAEGRIGVTPPSTVTPNEYGYYVDVTDGAGTKITVSVTIKVAAE